MSLSEMLRTWFLQPVAVMLTELTRIIDMDRTQLAAQLSTIASTLASLEAVTAKIGNETQALLDRVAELTVAVENSGNTTPEIDAALAAVNDMATSLAASLAAVDAKVPDGVDVPPPN